MSTDKVIMIAAAAFLVPIVGTVVLNNDKIQEALTVDPLTAEGHLLFFTSSW